MRTSFLTNLAVAGLAIAAPLGKRNNDGKSTDIDPVILNYALTLEHLEAAFYKQGLQKYSAEAFQSAAFPEWVRYRLSEIASHETTHVSFLTDALKAAGAQATAACEYSFPDNSPETFIAVAQILEGVGVSAYIGAANKITNPAYLQYAAQVLAVEARHSAWIRGAAQQLDSFPSPFDLALGLNQVYSLAAGFIKSCPSSNPTLPVKAFPVLTAGALESGNKVKLTYANAQSGAFATFITALGAESVALPSDGVVTVPSGLYGQNYVVITKTNGTATDDNTLAGPAIVEVSISSLTETPLIAPAWP
ncbi:BZ3500_MvSof-1268-A1-R1_Chr1-3g01738 [Microbotryum saponariae]|uniref:BZ3500_MvSof-1268-A1-R1_Chr1-3g01738 protein n=1 Tax=Microbotryum saponariae TaxID=289078 RepID=A0A2X0KLK0_9BASI|nr:BZ3500_MvSof-1268-A1-R1_Chr1-3g01738 [Microbotryum saponariae]SCZ94479.1 BZ3501_MvSof-1269-A2-R1_Chr1-3g01340 [Microbotryum saponariae]